ncbi:MAG: peptidylprolyl isomerase [Longimicrobiales bacterium]
MPSILARTVREPLVHFSLIAGALFVAAAVLRGDADRIEVSRAELDYRILQVEANEGTPLTDEERVLVEEAYIDERVLIREARAMGLEADERIDDILIQKMLHILSGDVIQPTDEELAAFYEQNQDRYATDASVTVDEVVVAPNATLPRVLLEGGSPDGLAAGAVVGSRVMERLTPDDLAQIFGDEGAALVTSAETGAWREVQQSSRGVHWVRIRERFGSVVPPLAVVRDAVRLDWIAEREQALLLDRVAELRANYSVVVEGR